jgi:hypothetical protein
MHDRYAVRWLRCVHLVEEAKLELSYRRQNTDFNEQSQPSVAACLDQVHFFSVITTLRPNRAGSCSALSARSIVFSVRGECRWRQCQSVAQAGASHGVAIRIADSASTTPAALARHG